ncbi:radical SAM protein [Aciduliprofundum sp. MAR08-339]|uniref:SPL family radical SAM protein n=1 Tax=Aciduliprofundum sp. (strain MAR08-339) TaxID=673860 RepID=UPI000A8A5C75
MYYMHIFDPWNFPLCTCPKKYTVDPYTGCEHRCIYCYITSYIRNPWKVRPKRDFLRLFERDLKNAKLKLPISMSNSSDPYPKVERELRITRGALNLTRRYDFSLLMLTKSDIVVRDIDVLENIRSVVAITITTLDENLANKLEPMAPSPERRLRALEKLRGAGIKTIVRLDPVIPGINDNEEEIREMVRVFADIGVRQIISSTYKVKPDNFRRVAGVFKDQAERLHRIYYENGEMVRGIRYAPRDLRLKILKRIRDASLKYGLDFSVCREGLPLNTASTCDGSHML